MKLLHDGSNNSLLALAMAGKSENIFNLAKASLEDTQTSQEVRRPD